MTRACLGAACGLTAGVCCAEEALVDLAALQALGDHVTSAVQRVDWLLARQLVHEYAASPAFNAHIGANLAEDLLPHEALRGVVEETLDRAMAVNSLADLARLGPTNATDLKLRMDFARCYSMRALAHLKRSRPTEADAAMALARSYMHDGVAPQASDLMRTALIAHALGRQADAWDALQSALLADSAVEQADPTYGPGVQAVVEAHEGRAVDLAASLTALRWRNAAAVPDLALLRHDGTRFTLSERRGEVLFINFFSPYCGTCRMELPAAKALADLCSQPGRVEFLFLLNQPQSADVAARFLAAVGVPMERVVTLQQGNAYDYIAGEPAVWILDDAGRLVARHVGYREGDAAVYEAELRRVRARASSP